MANGHPVGFLSSAPERNVVAPERNGSAPERNHTVPERNMTAPERSVFLFFFQIESIRDNSLHSSVDKMKILTT